MARRNNPESTAQNDQPPQSEFRNRFHQLLVARIIADKVYELTGERPEEQDPIEKDSEKEEFLDTPETRRVRQDLRHWDRMHDRARIREKMLKERYEQAKEERQRLRGEYGASQDYLWKLEGKKSTDGGEQQRYGELDENNFYEPFGGVLVYYLVKDAYELSLERGEVITAEHNGRTIVMDASKYENEEEAIEDGSAQWQGDREMER